MALRVLLADESSTIKKVFQLALQDFAVEVRPVNIGVDVLPVAKNFQPDIIFADVLLQKKSGYEVSAELKTDPHLGKVPIVLMWSGFMELDEDKFQASHANGRLEKPFDVSTLRKLVTDLVPKTQSQRMSQFLSFPKMPEMQEAQRMQEHATASAPKAEEDFQQVSIPKMKKPMSPQATPPAPERFRVNVESEEDPNLTNSLKMSDETIDVETIFRNADEPDQFTLREMTATGVEPSLPPPVPPSLGRVSPTHAPAHAPTASNPNLASIPKLTEADIEKIIRSQAQEMIEAVVWKVLPELAQQIIEREIQKLLKEKDASLYR